MAKTESTAVNELIDLVQNQRPKPASEPSDDLFGAPKAPQTTRVNPPRMTATIPPMRGAGELPPLPRTRSAGGTSQHKLPDVPPPQVRMSTAPPSRGQTIPPIPQPPTRGSAPLPPPKPSSPGLPAPVRNTSSAPVISPVRATQAQPAIPERPGAKPTLPMPKGTRPPAGSPVAAPFEQPPEPPPPAGANPFVAMPLAYPVVQRPARIDMTGDAVSAENWFEASRAVEKFEEETYIGTSPVVRQERRRNETMLLLGKMIVPTIVLVIVGILIGGYIAFDGEGGAKKPAPAARQAAVAQAEPAAKAPAVVTAKDSAPQPSTESANAATATAGGEQPEPPAKADDSGKLAPEATAAKAEPTAPETAKAEPAPAKTEPAPAKSEPAPAKSEPAPAKSEPAPAKVAAAAPAVREVQTTRGVVKLADVRIDSKPAGATVMLVDNGKTSFLGTTPLATSLDPSRQYDLVFTLQGRPTQMAHLDPTRTPHLDMTLGKTVTEVKAPATPAVAKTEPAPAHHHAAKSAAPALADPGFDTAPAPKAEAPKKPEKAAKAEKTEKSEPAKTEKTEAKPDKPAKADKAVADAPKAEPAKPDKAAGTGTLMVSSKPPCEILIDGKATGLTTPQRAIPLPPGAHKITFVNTAQNINKTVAVSISADQTTKLVKDLLQ